MSWQRTHHTLESVSLKAAKSGLVCLVLKVPSVKDVGTFRYELGRSRNIQLSASGVSMSLLATQNQLWRQSAETPEVEGCLHFWDDVVYHFPLNFIDDINYDAFFSRLRLRLCSWAEKFDRFSAEELSKAWTNNYFLKNILF